MNEDQKLEIEEIETPENEELVKLSSEKLYSEGFMTKMILLLPTGIE